MWRRWSELNEVRTELVKALPATLADFRAALTEIDLLTQERDAARDALDNEREHVTTLRMQLADMALEKADRDDAERKT